MSAPDGQVGVVLVSHSAEVARSVVELALGLSAGGTPPPAEKSTPAAAQSPAKAPAEGAKASAADPRLAEVSRHGVIPKMGSGGVRASEVYTSPLAAAAAASGSVSPTTSPAV